MPKKTKPLEWRSYPIQCPDCGHINRGAFPPSGVPVMPFLWDACAGCGHVYHAEILTEGEQTTIRVKTGKTIEQIVEMDKIVKVIL